MAPTRPLHLHNAEVGSHAGQLLDQHVSTLRESLDCVVVLGEMGTVQQELASVQLISDSSHCRHLRSLYVGTLHVGTF